MLRLGWFLLCTFGFLGVAQANEYPLREDGADIFGQVERIRTRYEDTLIQIARRYSLGYEELLRVNQGVDPWLPGEGTEVLIPGQRLLPPGEREGIVVNLPEHRLYYFPKPKKDEPATVLTYPVSDPGWRLSHSWHQQSGCRGYGGDSRVLAHVPRRHCDPV